MPKEKWVEDFDYVTYHAHTYLAETPPPRIYFIGNGLWLPDLSMKPDRRTKQKGEPMSHARFTRILWSLFTIVLFAAGGSIVELIKFIERADSMLPKLIGVVACLATFAAVVWMYREIKDRLRVSKNDTMTPVASPQEHSVILGSTNGSKPIIPLRTKKADYET